MQQGSTKLILPIIVLSQFACTSLWFAGNAVLPDLVKYYHVPSNALAHLSSSVQLGFISGTFIFALLTITDRFSPSKVFFWCAIAAAFTNIGIIAGQQTLGSILFLRMLTGFLLAGIYPVGMKIAADYFDKELGKALGYLVGALVLGTAFPYLLKTIGADLPWKSVMICTSILSIIGGLLIVLFIPDGPNRRKSTGLNVKAIGRVFTVPGFRAAAFGYFGHMWELYAFWTFVPVMLVEYNTTHASGLNVPLTSFFIIAAGSLSCILGGFISIRKGNKKTAFAALLVSGVMCLLSPFLFYLPSRIFLFFITLWSLAVIADSPQFSAMVASQAPVEYKGTALTIVNCIGFSITIISIEAMKILLDHFNPVYVFTFLALGPVFGLISLSRFPEKNSAFIVEKA